MKVKCNQCGKEFDKIPSLIKRAKHNFCSRECKGKWQSINLKEGNATNWKGGKIKRVCLICGKKLDRMPSQINEHIFCSQKCTAKWKSKYQKGENSPKWKPKIQRICKICGKEFESTLIRVKNARGRFCSQECKGKWQSENLSGANSSSWKGGKIVRTCLVCGKEFKIKPSVVKHGHGNFCSLKCARKAQKKFPKYHTKPEIIAKTIFDKNNIPFRYTGDGSFWIENCNPDFIECNGKKIAVEIFGDYWHSPLLGRNIPHNQTYEGRKGILKKYGWKLIVFWETDLKRMDVEQFILTTLKKEGVNV